jgi:cell division cycle protein 20 (cofactor of APC complex)
LLSKEPNSAAVFPSKEVHGQPLAENLLLNVQSRILAFKSKPPPPPEGFVNGRQSLLSQNVAGTAKPKKMFRDLPQAPESLYF